MLCSFHSCWKEILWEHKTNKRERQRDNEKRKTRKCWKNKQIDGLKIKKKMKCEEKKMRVIKKIQIAIDNRKKETNIVTEKNEI